MLSAVAFALARHGWPVTVITSRQRYDAPGAVLPARIMLGRMLKLIETTDGLCAYDRVTSDAWRGCPKAKSGYYEKTREKGIGAIVPQRDEDVMARDKAESLDAMKQADAITVRPHILVCAAAQYGNGIRPPYPPDNLPELLQHIIKHPDTPGNGSPDGM